MDDVSNNQNDNSMLMRKQVLAKARLCVCENRESTHGEPEYSFAKIANLWDGYLKNKGADSSITAEDVTMMMVLFKVARVQSGIFNEDNFVDMAGYAACGASCSKK